jgi:hypothetical protein
MGCQGAPRALLFIVTADFEKRLNLHPADMDHLFTTTDVAVRALDHGLQFGLLARGESSMERPVYFCGPPAAQRTFTDRADSV